VPDNVADTVRRAASRSADAVAIVSTDAASVPARLTWAELDARVDAVAAALRGLELPASGGAPARIAIALPQVPEFAEAFFGILRAGLVAVPANPGYTARELRHVLADSGAVAMITTAAVAATLEPVRMDLSALELVYTVDPGHPGTRPYPELTAAAAPVTAVGEGEDLAVLIYTSGTAGVPKGAMLSHRALLANQSQVAAVDPPIVSPGDVVLLALPLFHIFGLSSGLVAVAYHGACGVLVDRFEPARTLAVIARHQVSVVAAVPQMYVAWSSQPDLAEHLTSVRVAVSGAAPLDAAVARRFLETTRHPIFEGYGLTETAPVVATALASPVPKVRSIGRPIPGVEVNLIGADGTDIARVTSDGLSGGVVDDFDDDAGGVPGTDPGEIVVRGANLFSGYWPDGAGGPDADGWWRTGDVAYADADGDLFLVDRLGELILVSGFNVYPHEVELVLTAHPGVAEAAVVGIPDPSTGEAVTAYVVAVEGGAVATEDLKAHCERNLARFKCPTVIEFVAELPHSAIGKVRKATLLANLQAAR
jgi:long-chain acyl-CoA synthetase